MQNSDCLIWAPFFDESAVNWDIRDVAEVNSERTGGRYRISLEAFLLVRRMNEFEKARLTTWLVDQRMQGVRVPEITTERKRYATSRRNLPVHERADRLLRFLAEQVDTVGVGIDLNENTLSAFAWSESIKWKEVVYLLNYLRDSGWLNHSGTNNRVFENSGLVQGIVTVEGYSRIAEQSINVDSAQTFVAMWFNKETELVFKQGIVPAIEAAGFKPFRADLVDFLDKIDDKIVAEIRRSRFLVADMTHGIGGARGSVYFEAGFALGLGIPVIFTCRDDMLDELHFDTRQYPHIGWKENEVDTLCSKLENRIRALIGEGPLSSI